MNPFAFLLMLFSGTTLRNWYTARKSETSSDDQAAPDTDELVLLSMGDTDTDTEFVAPEVAQFAIEPAAARPVVNNTDETQPEEATEPSLVVEPVQVAPDLSFVANKDITVGSSAAPLDEPVVNYITSDLSTVMTGRVTTLKVDDDFVEIRLTSNVDHGTVTVNPDNSFAVVLTMTDYVGDESFSYEATHSDGSVTHHLVNLNVTEGAQAGGWGTGADHYMLETDEDDRVIVEHGDVHTKVYITGNDAGLTIAEIAEIEGLQENQITGKWLIQNGSYGQSEDLALAEDSGHLLWKALTPPNSDTSHWLLLERGHEYDDLGRILSGNVNGEDELHPLYIGAWGEGEKPEITTQFKQFQESTENVVIQDIHFTGGVFWLEGKNVIFDNVTVSEEGLSMQGAEGVTIRQSEFLDIVREESLNGGDWELHLDRISGIYINRADGVLLENTLVDKTGWAEDYSPVGDASGGQPPSLYSQNIYMGDEITDITMRDVITMRGSSFGAQIRSGGFIEDNLFLDNNAALDALGGDYQGKGNVGQYSLITDNVATSGAHRTTEIGGGAKTQGVVDRGNLTSMVDNIVAHLADPNNPDEIADKIITHQGLGTNDPLFDNTIVWNWIGTERVWNEKIVTEQNADDLDANVLDQTTIQNFTAQLLDKPDATISDLADYLRTQGDGAFDDVVDADLIISFFQQGFGINPDVRDDAATLRFVPNDLGDGVRWDNRLNWDSEDLPGTQNGDNVDLAGNHVVYGGTTVLGAMDMGDGGQLDISHGKLTVDDAIFAEGKGGFVNISESGQFWNESNVGTGTLDVDLSGGRFVNAGTIENTSLTASDGQVILATGGAEYNLDADQELAVVGSDAQVGFDGDDNGIAILDMQEDSTLSFSADDGALGTIGEFRSGTFGDESDVRSGIDLGDSTLEIDLAGLDANAGSVFTLMESDELVGTFKDANITGLVDQDATITVDYETDRVMLEIASGTGNVAVETVGDEDQHKDAELWNSLTQDQSFVEDMPIVTEESDLFFDA